MAVDLRNAYLFATLDEPQLQRIEAMSRALSVSNGDTLFRFGDPARRFFLVTDGQIKLYRLSPDGNEKVIDLIRPGHTFAEALMFLEQPSYPVTATALGETQLLAFDNQAFLDLLRDSVDTCFRLLGDMSQRLHGLIREIDDLTLQSATCRMAAMLIRHLQGSKLRRFTLHAPKGVLASRLSVKPETFSRILHNLSNKGIISVRGNTVTVHDLRRLQALAHIDGGCEPSNGALLPSQHCPSRNQPGRR